MQKLAKKAIKETLQLKPLETTSGENIYPTHANRLEAARMVVDRVDPIVKHVQTASISYTKVDLSQYCNDFEGEP